MRTGLAASGQRYAVGAGHHTHPRRSITLMGKWLVRAVPQRPVQAYWRHATQVPDKAVQTGMRRRLHIDLQTFISHIKTGLQYTIYIMHFDQQIILGTIIQPVEENGTIWRILTHIQIAPLAAAVRILDLVGCPLNTKSRAVILAIAIEKAGAPAQTLAHCFAGRDQSRTGGAQG